ncbi:YigZ family protein [uncultured Arcobacter sp.]|uniref:YigZ family protein n=1 Tax=uncultured Arcobacter sp. TaxID=165434 RepID=UPI002632B515|nr:YigZ family protein [uncultured Arcobacter sp.]
MKFVQKEFSSTFEEKKSKFLAFLAPYSEFNDVMQRLKSEHPKARHFVYAYRYLNEFDQVIENSSDDGEPKGTSGKPCLNVIAGNELINSFVIVVRYFGGVKLGTGGLVRAYSDAVNSVINISQLETYQKLQIQNLRCEYSELSKLEYIIKNSNINIINKEFDSSVNLTLESTKEDFELFNTELPLGVKLQ